MGGSLFVGYFLLIGKFFDFHFVPDHFFNPDLDPAFPCCSTTNFIYRVVGSTEQGVYSTICEATMPMLGL